MSEGHEPREQSTVENNVLSQPLILIENIESIMLELFRDLFEDWGYTNLLFAHDHTEAITLARNHDCDLAVLDFISAGGGTGYGATETIKAMYEGRGGVAIIGIASCGLPYAEERFMGAGADAFVSTPFSMYFLRDVVHRFLPVAGTPRRSL